MALTSYWWYIIWMFTGGLMIYSVELAKRKSSVENKNNSWRWISAILLVFPYILWAAFRRGMGDSEVYRRTFLLVPSSLSKFSEYICTITKDRGYYALLVVIKSIIGNKDILYFLIFAVIQMSCLVVLFRRYSSDYWMSIYIFVASTEYISWMQNGMRQFTAVMLVYAATPLILKKKYLKAGIIILLASTIHGSALLMLPVMFLLQGEAFNKKTIWCIAGSIVILIFINQFTNMLDVMLSDTQYTNVVSDWKSIEDDGMNPIRVLVYAVPMILAWIGLKRIRKENNSVINLAANASILATALGIIAMGTSGIFIGRLPIYVSLYSSEILLPWEMENLFTKNSVKIVKILAIVFYFAFFFYQMRVTWGAL